LPRTIMGKTQEVEGFRLALTTLLPSRGGEPPELDQPRLVGVQDQAEFPEAFPPFTQELFGLAAVLKPDEESSSPGAFHPEALAEPDVELAPHPALMTPSPVVSRSATKRTDSGRGAPPVPAHGLRW